MKRNHLALLLLLLLVVFIPACDEEAPAENGEAAETGTESDAADEGAEVVDEEPAAPFAVGDTVWATYYDPEYITSLSWESAEVIEVGEETVTVEFQGFLNEGETDERAFEWVYPYVEAWEADDVKLGTTVVVNPEGFSDSVNYPGEVTAIEMDQYTVAYTMGEEDKEENFTLDELH